MSYLGSDRRPRVQMRTAPPGFWASCSSAAACEEEALREENEPGIGRILKPREMSGCNLKDPSYVPMR